jgi:hypothetical protein
MSTINTQAENTLKDNQEANKMLARRMVTSKDNQEAIIVELDQYHYTITPEKKGKSRFISVDVLSGKNTIGRVESYGPSMKLYFGGIKFDICTLFPGGTGPTFPIPDCPDSTNPDDILVIRASGSGIETREASIANGEQLVEFLKGIAPEFDQRASRIDLNGFRELTDSLQTDVVLRAVLRVELQNVLNKGRSPQRTAKQVDTEDVDDAVDKGCKSAGWIPVVGAFCGGYEFGKLLRDWLPW